MTIEGAFSQLIVKTNSNPKFDMHIALLSKKTYGAMSGAVKCTSVMKVNTARE